MARSFKKAIVTCSKRAADNVHSAARHLVRQRLSAMDYTEPTDEDLSLIDADVHELGLENMEFDDDEDWDTDWERLRRK